MGSFWGNVLHHLYGMLVALLGWSATLLTDGSTAEGNVVFVHLVFDAQLLQPCNPSSEIFSLMLYTAFPSGHLLTRDGQSCKPGMR